jgi:hypothetical protein
VPRRDNEGQLPLRANFETAEELDFGVRCARVCKDVSHCWKPLPSNAVKTVTKDMRTLVLCDSDM